MKVRRIVALHGLPTSPRLWERLEVPRGWVLERPPVPGLGPDGTPDAFSLEWAAERLRARTEGADVVMGHDLGGVLAAMLARPDQAVVLSGTALGHYWAAIRATAKPLVNRLFYHRYAGRLFLRNGGLVEHRGGLDAAFGDHGEGWAERMRTIAAAMRPPPGLGRRLRAQRVLLAWGRHDPWYPVLPVGRGLAWSTGGELAVLEAGHFAPWEAPTAFSERLASFLAAGPEPGSLPWEP